MENIIVMSRDDEFVLDVMQIVLQAGSPFSAVTKPTRPLLLGWIEPDGKFQGCRSLDTPWIPCLHASNRADLDLTFGTRPQPCCACTARCETKVVCRCVDGLVYDMMCWISWYTYVRIPKLAQTQTQSKHANNRYITFTNFTIHHSLLYCVRHFQHIYFKDQSRW